MNPRAALPTRRFSPRSVTRGEEQRRESSEAQPCSFSSNAALQKRFFTGAFCSPEEAQNFHADPSRRGGKKQHLHHQSFISFIIPVEKVEAACPGSGPEPAAFLRSARGARMSGSDRRAFRGPGHTFPKPEGGATEENPEDAI